ncbi:MAG: FtsX-like permease family protein [Planctomycetota bacterium]
MEADAGSSNSNPLRTIGAPVLALVGLGVMILPFIFNAAGPLAYRQPGDAENVRKKKRRVVSPRDKLKIQAEKVDIKPLAVRIEQDVRRLVETDGPGSRTGRYAGSEQESRVAAAIAERFRAAGLQAVSRQKVRLPRPVTRELSFKVDGKPYRLLPLTPNLVRTCTVNAPDNKLATHVVYGGNAALGDGYLLDAGAAEPRIISNLSGKDLAGSILVLEGDQGFDWLAACSLGPSAVIFVEPENPRMFQARLKLLGTVLDMPRFWMPRAEWERLRTASPALLSEGAAEKLPPAELVCRVDWELGESSNVYGLMPGTDSERAEDITVICAHFDASSVVPEMAPGAEAAASMAAMFELLSRLEDRKPRRTLLFVAMGAHYPGMAGPREAAQLLQRPVKDLVREIGELEQDALGRDPMLVLRAAGREVSGLRPWQRVLLIVLGFIALIVAVVGSYRARLKFRAAVGAMTAVMVVSITLLCLLGAWMGRKRRLSPEEVEKQRVQQIGYRELRTAIEDLKPHDGKLYESMKAVIDRRDALERDAILAHNKIENLVKRMASGAKDEAWRAEYDRQARDLRRTAGRAADPDPEIRELLIGLLSVLGVDAPEGDVGTIREDLEKKLKTVRKSDPKLFKLVNDINDEVDQIEERLKTSGPKRLKFKRLCSYLAFLAELGPDVPERVKSCVGIDLSSHSDRMAVFFKGGYINQHIDKNEKKLQTAVSLLAGHLSASGSAHAASQGWAPPEGDSPFVIDTSETIAGMEWREVAPGSPHFDVEMLTLTGFPSVTFGTAIDARPLISSPMDLPERMDFLRLARQVEVFCRALVSLLHPGSEDLNEAAVTSWARLGLTLSADKKAGPEAGLRDMLSSDARAALVRASEGGELGAADKKAVVDGLNRLIAGKLLHGQPGLAGLQLSGEALTFSDKLGRGEDLGESDQRRFNRLVVEAILPDVVRLSDLEKGLNRLERMEAECDFKRGNMCLRLSGQVIEYNPAKSKTLSVTPVPGAVVIHWREAKTYRSTVRPFSDPVRPAALAITDRFGAYEFYTLSNAKQRVWSDTYDRVMGFELDKLTGNVSKAPDEGPEGKKYREPWRTPKGRDDEFVVVTFACQALNIFEAGDLRSLEAVNSQYENVNMYKGTVDAVPISYGWSMVGKTGQFTFPEHAMVLFTDRRGGGPGGGDKGGGPVPVSLKATFGRKRLAGVRWPTLGVAEPADGLTKTGHTGSGLTVMGSSRVVDPDSEQFKKGRVVVANTERRPVPLIVTQAQDLFRLDHYRLAVLEKAGVKNRALVTQHEDASREYEALMAAKAEKRWDDMITSARSAWGYEARGYPNIQTTVTDVVKGLLFYLFLMLPFAYFMERLLFASPDINRQLFGVFGMFILSFAVLYVVHPAFGITSSAPMILLSFITMALAILVMSMISTRFRREIEELQRRPGRSHKADMDRFNAAISAFLLGINNMRRRKVRTMLTMITLVLLTFSVLSFSSIESTLGANRREIPTSTQPTYQGVLIRSESWIQLDPYAYRMLRDEFGKPEKQCLVAPRCWAKKRALQNSELPEESYNVPGVLGVKVLEQDFTGLGLPHTLLAGRWFTEKEVREKTPVCLLDEAMMAELKIDIGRVTAVHDLHVAENFNRLPHVTIGGEQMAIIGVLRTDPYQAADDIDGERIVPVDWEVETWQKNRGKGRGSEELEFRKYQHVMANKVPVVGYDWLMDRGKAAVYSVAIRPVPPPEGVPFGTRDEEGRLKVDELKAREMASAIAEEQLLRRISVPMFLSSLERPAADSSVKTMFMSTAASNDVSGVGSLLVPMLIAALIVLNTMLGSVYERESEISIYGSLGLAPVHIGSLFIAESAVYAVVSAVVGYILGQSVSKLVVVLGAEGLLAGFSLNYSSLSAVFSACFIIAVVMLSAAYPAMRAGQLSVPDVERIWRFPEPEGGRLVFDFPFTVSGEQALGINVHLKNFFEDHANQSVGEFYTADTVFDYLEKKEGEKPSYVLRSRVWIAPFDFGISQALELETYLSEGEVDIYETRMTLTRASGSPDAWVKMNHRFMKSIRKQFLLWRLFTPEERAWHVAKARVLLGELSPEEVPDRLAGADEDELGALPEPG